MTTSYAYARVTVQGQTLNRRTNHVFVQIVHIYHLLGGTGTVGIAQGSYHAGPNSGGTHLGGGALDLTCSVQTDRNYRILQKAARLCMCAAWWRKPLYRDGKLVWSHHVHLIVIGDKEMSSEAAAQIRDYYAGRDGLASHALEPASVWRPTHLFPPSYPRTTVDFSVVVAQAKRTSGYTSSNSVKRLQMALNLKLGADLKVDGLYGKATKAAYRHWEAVILGDWDKADAVPSTFTLTLLGAARFNVQA